MGTPKALLDFRGETFLDGLIRAFSESCAPVVVVLGAEAERIRGGLRYAEKAHIVVNADYRRGQITSLQCGLRAVPADARGVLFTLVDHPNVRQSTLQALLGRSGAPLVIPRYRGRRGHPVFCARELVPEFLALGAEESAKTVVERHGAGITYVEVDDPGILEDVDDPEAYLRLVKADDAQG
jgi:molybdenum cofactor cytidylyltransferase